MATIKERGRYADGGNLYLVVSKSGAKKWSFIFRERGTSRSREMGLGSAGAVSLAVARDRAARARLMIGEGTDPLAAKSASMAQLSTPTFEEMMEELVAARSPGWRNKKHRGQWASSLRRYASSLLDKRVDEITTSDVHVVLKPLWSTKTETASRVRQRIERVLDRAKALGHRGGENPARWQANLDLVLPMPSSVRRVTNRPALPVGEIPAFMSKLRAKSGVPARALEFVIVTCVRTAEGRGARWEEFDTDRFGAQAPH